jgi:hypothetical protein
MAVGGDALAGGGPARSLADCSCAHVAMRLTRAPLVYKVSPVGSVNQRPGGWFMPREK